MDREVGVGGDNDKDSQSIWVARTVINLTRSGVFLPPSGVGSTTTLVLAPPLWYIEATLAYFVANFWCFPACISFNSALVLEGLVKLIPSPRVQPELLDGYYALTAYGLDGGCRACLAHRLRGTAHCPLVPSDERERVLIEELQVGGSIDIVEYLRAQMAVGIPQEAASTKNQRTNTIQRGRTLKRSM